MTLAQRIKTARLALGLSQQALATAIGRFGDCRPVSRAAVAQWESGHTREIEAANLLKAAYALNVTPEWLQFGAGEMKPASVHLEELRPIACDAHIIPLFTDAQLVSVRRIQQFPVDLLSTSGIDPVLARITGLHVFTLQVEGTSMSPLFKVDDIVVIDPAIQPQPGEVVVAKLLNANRILLRKYRPLSTDAANNPRVELIPFNDNWPKIVTDSENPMQIMGTLVEHRCRRRLYSSETFLQSESIT